MTFHWNLRIALFSAVSFGALFCLLTVPAAAQEYQVSVTLTDDSTIPAPLSYTFDTATPFQTSGAVSYSNLSVNFDSQCGSNCTVGAVSYNANESQISYSAQGQWFAWAIGCSVWFGNGNCTVDPPVNVSQAGVVYTAQNGTIVVNQIAGTNSSPVPESSSYFELAGLGCGLLLWVSRRFLFIRQTAPRA